MSSDLRSGLWDSGRERKLQKRKEDKKNVRKVILFFSLIFILFLPVFFLICHLVSANTKKVNKVINNNNNNKLALFSSLSSFSPLKLVSEVVFLSAGTVASWSLLPRPLAEGRICSGKPVAADGIAEGKEKRLGRVVFGEGEGKG